MLYSVNKSTILYRQSNAIEFHISIFSVQQSIKNCKISPQQNLNSFYSFSRRQQSSYKVVFFENFEKSVSD